jgi:phosphoglycerol transferase MdoB-like AlkP superfamily enzyme
VNEIAFLATISKNIMYRTCHPVETRKQSDYRSAMHEVIKVYNQAGLHVSVVYADQEFEPLLSKFKNKNLIDEYTIAPAGEHVPQAEQNNRTIQD